MSMSHIIGVGFGVIPPTLAHTVNTNGGLDIVWPDVYTGQLVRSAIALLIPPTGGITFG